MLRTRAVTPLVWLMLAGVAAGTEADDEALRLVERLGDTSFLVREEAARALRDRGTTCIPLLLDASESEDLEIRYRARRLLEDIEADDHRQQLERFREDAGGDAGATLPGWESYRQAVGDGPAERALFIEMHEAEPRLFRQIEKRGDLRTAYEQRVVELQYIYAQRNDRKEIMRNVGALLHIGVDADLETSVQTGYTFYSFLNFNEFRQALADGDRGPVLRKVLGNWIAHPHGATTYLKVNLALQQNLEEGLGPAVRLIREGASASQLQYALLAVGRFGGAEHVPLLEPLLEDASILTTSRSNARVTYSCQTRDVALAVLLHLTGEDPRPYGFSRLTKNPQYLYAPTSMGFSSDEQRAAALARWATSGPGAPVEAPLPSEDPVEAPIP